MPISSLTLVDRTRLRSFAEHSTTLMAGEPLSRSTPGRENVRIRIGSEIGCGRSAGPSPSESRCCWPQMLVEKCDHALGIVGRKDWSNELTEIKDNGCVLLGAVQI